MKGKTQSYRPGWSVLMAALFMLAAAGCDREELDIEELAATETEEVTGNQRPHQYRLQFEGEEQVVGREGEVTYEFLPGPGLKINLEFPWKVEFEGETEGLSLGKEDFDLESIELTEDVASLRIPVTAETEGRHEVNGYASFSVCNEDRCDIFQREPVRFVVDAREETTPD